MAYSKQTWDTTSIFNPTRMNHIENGIESASTADGTEYSSGVSVKTQIDKKAGKLVINTLNSTSFSYDSNAKYWYSNNSLSYYYGSRKVFGLYVRPSYEASSVNAYIRESDARIIVAGIVTTNMTVFDSQYTFKVVLAMEDYS